MGEGADSTREWAIRIVASLAKGWLTQGATVGAAWDGQFIPPSSGARHLETLLDALAKIPETTDGTLVEVLDTPPCRNFSRRIAGDRDHGQRHEPRGSESRWAGPSAMDRPSV